MIDDLVLDIGRQEWNTENQGPWASKTDVIQYKKCRYKVSLNHQERIPYQEFLKPELRNFFFAGGIEFETKIVEGAIDKEELRSAASIKDIPSQDGLVRILSPIRNHELGIVGMPDMLSVENGRLVPVEIKNHSYVTRLDKIELAFYWRLLEPIQKGRRGRDRKGYVVLNSGERREVPLNNEDVDELNQLISEVRRTKLKGAQPRLVKECDLCVFRDEHLPLIYGAGDVSLVYDVGPARHDRLEELGITTISQLAEADTDKLLARWRQSRKGAASSDQIQNMQAHAKALLTNEPQIVGRNPMPELGKAILLDLEYLPDRIFVVGALVVEDGKEIALHQEFADISKDERALLTSLTDLLKSCTTHKIVTYGGSAADMPALEKAWSRLRLPEDGLGDMCQRHIDLYYTVRDNFRLPTSSLGLKDVASHFGFERAHDNVSSFFIPMKYNEFLATNNQILKQEILDHNADDVRSLLHTWSRLRDLMKSEF